MKTANFIKYTPGGNPTILITAPEFPKSQHPRISEEILSPMHLQAEQAGFISLQNSPVHLDMMGGEFCINATRCLVFEAARSNKFLPLEKSKDLFGLVSSSGMKEPLQVRIENYLKDDFTKQTCYVAIKDSTIEVLHKEAGVYLVNLPGITHLLLDSSIHPEPLDVLFESTKWRDKYSLNTYPASGVIWYKRTDTCNNKNSSCSITPVVHVHKTATTILESGCGSGSLAVSAVLHELEENSTCEVLQPSGKKLFINYISALGLIEIGGEVTLVAEGKLYLS